MRDFSEISSVNWETEQYITKVARIDHDYNKIIVKTLYMSSKHMGILC